MEGQAFQNEDGTPINTDEEAQLETMKLVVEKMQADETDAYIKNITKD